MSFVSTIFRWPFESCSYSYLPKKDDDMARMQAEAWITANPIHAEHIRQMNSPEKLNAYGKKVIKGLKTFPIDSSNEDLIRNYLVAICKTQNVMQDYFLKHIHELKGDTVIIKKIKETIIFT